MAQGRSNETNSAGGEQHGPTADASTLSPTQARILRIIERAILETGLPMTRSELARAAGYRRASSIEGVLLALVRKQAIIMDPKAHRTMRIADHDGARIIDAGSRVDTDEELPSEQRMIDRMPGKLALRLKVPARYFLKAHDDSLKGLGIARGDIAAIGRTIRIRNGSIVLARDERGAILNRRAVVTEDHELKLVRIDRALARHQARQERSSTESTLRIEGVVTGVVQTRALGRPRPLTKAQTRTGEARARRAPETEKRARPTRAPTPSAGAAARSLADPHSATRYPCIARRAVRRPWRT